MKRNILFVDRGNIFRSVLAGEYLQRKLAASDYQKDNLEIVTRGVNDSTRYYNFYFYKNTYHQVSALVTALMGFRDTDFFKNNKRCRLSQEDLRVADAIFVLDDYTMDYIKDNFYSDILGKEVFFRPINDPGPINDMGEFEQAIKVIKIAIDEFLDKFGKNDNFSFNTSL